MVRAVTAGELHLEALVRGAYPGRPMPAGVLAQVRSVGFWDAAHDQTWGLGEHRNEGIEITYLDNGHLGFVVDGQSHPLSSGQLSITRPWQPHSVGRPTISASRLYWIILDLKVRQPHQAWKWPPWLVLAPADIKKLTALLRENEHPVWSGTSEIGQCFTDMGQLIESSRTGLVPASRLTLLLNEVFVCLLELLQAQNPPRKISLTLGERSVAMFLDRLKHELGDPWTLELMSEKVGLARTRFAHHCRKLTNLSPMGYLQQQRVEKAKVLLASSRCPIVRIAMDCGFASSAYFASVFRHHTQCSPRQYRLEHGNRSME